ncbi:hypothetical protein [Sinanaerobacter sp. ZZT-01]|uniref:hypothetical protein n=1 Tax=Sinanaerobacter sp. ZZT-01 TaxID=3111540 RepID=UPI002D779D04|nr:hypothetical protein [Sinanaerobacter sp. ZZT-01]WRR93362.1 hypothetical protein U5921_15235 [Sinanaerobacter sp. ZZT-01]
MLNVIAGVLGREPEIRTVELANGKTNVASTTIYIHTAKNRPSIPVNIHAWGDNAKELMKYGKGESIHFIGQPTANQYKNASMEKPIQTMGFSIQKIDHKKVFMKNVDDLFKRYIRMGNLIERYVADEKQKEAGKNEKPQLEVAQPTLG